ncbi:MAG: hypothetical protein JWN73_2270 [Betaproteobacteria bacterium]|nr:hypothetical protein [Betaproteobacteria bacterium]
MKKPVLAWIVQIALALIALIYGASAVFSLAVGVGRWFILTPALIGFLIAGAIAFYAARLLWQATQQTAGSRALLIFFWAVLLIYPVTNVLSAIGWYPPKLQIAPEQMMGAAIAEAARYLLLLALIVWLSFSKATRAWLGAQRRAPSLFAFGAPVDNPDSSH